MLAWLQDPRELCDCRGRLNVLCNLLGKPFGALCSEMEGKQSDFKVGEQELW
jgi:hypothetical protein